MDVSDADDAVTDLLRRWAKGDSPAGDRLFSRVYEQLRHVARQQRRRWVGDETLNTTALVHEVFLRMTGARELAIHDRAHFYAVAARATRQILSNYARRGRTKKRGPGTPLLDIADAPGLPPVEALEPSLGVLTALEEALQQLHRIHPRPCRVVECRFFGGLSIPETALALNISDATVKRDWALAQSWLCRELREHAPDHV